MQRYFNTEGQCQPDIHKRNNRPTFHSVILAGVKEVRVNDRVIVEAVVYPERVKYCRYNVLEKIILI